jgi:hypothetical protein
VEGFPLVPSCEDAAACPGKALAYAGRMANGFVYWIYLDEASMLLLNTTTLQFSRMDLPPYLQGRTHMFRVGNTKDGMLCIVVAIAFKLYVWVRKICDDG